MIFRKTPCKDGEYITDDGKRWTVECCRRIRTSEGVNVGWTEFPSLDDALEAWGLKEESALMPPQNRKCSS